MPKKQPARAFVESNLRYFVTCKKATYAQRLQALERFIQIQHNELTGKPWAYDAQVGYPEPKLTPAETKGDINPQAEDRVNAMLERAAKLAGGGDAKLPNSQSSGS